MVKKKKKKKSACNAEDLGLIPGSGKSPGEGNGYPLQYSCLGESHGQRSLEGYSPWGHKESDTTEPLTHTHTHTHTHIHTHIHTSHPDDFHSENSILQFRTMTLGIHFLV